MAKTEPTLAERYEQAAQESARVPFGYRWTVDAQERESVMAAVHDAFAVCVAAAAVVAAEK